MPGLRHHADDGLISDYYRLQNRKMHAMKESRTNKKGFGKSGRKWAGSVDKFARTIKAKTIIDYGAGKCTLGERLRSKGYKVTDYDPALKHIDSLPTKPADLVTCTDVLEHIESDRLDAVLDTINRLMLKGGFFVICTKPADKRLPNGSGTHKIVKSKKWWIDKLSRYWLLTIHRGRGLSREIVLTAIPTEYPIRTNGVKNAA